MSSLGKRWTLPRRPAIDRFIENYRIDASGCWLWTGHSLPRGYGRICLDYVDTYAHRLAWELCHGAIPAGMDVCHRCDVPSCVNPDHLFVGTRADNMRDASAKGRTARGGGTHGACKLTAAQVVAIRSDAGYQHVVAARYGVSQTTVGEILRRVTWRHV